MTDSTTDSCGSAGDRSHDTERFFTCLKCTHVVSAIQQDSLIVAVDCPGCGREKTFGPGVFVEDFQGYTWSEVIDQKKRKAVAALGATFEQASAAFAAFGAAARKLKEEEERAKRHLPPDTLPP